MTLQLRTTINTQPWNLGGDANFRDDVTLERIIGRATDVLFLTVLAMVASAQKMIPLADVNPALTSASFKCGASGSAVAGYQNADNEFAITVDGILINIQWDGTAIVALTDIAGAINAISVPLGVFCSYNEAEGATGTFYFASLKKGLPASTITALTAVVAGAGTDISGAGLLNGLAGTITAATGDISSAVPAGILGMDDVAFAAIDAADQTDQKVITSGKTTKYFDEQFVILEGGLTFETVIPSTGKTIRTMLEDIGLVVRPSENTNQIAPLD